LGKKGDMKIKGGIFDKRKGTNGSREGARKGDGVCENDQNMLYTCMKLL
jgi:hypothetical protein